MGATFVVTLREAFEAALLLGIVYAYLERVGARTEYRWVTLGGVLGLVASVAAGVAVSFLSGPLLDPGPDLVAAAVVFVAGAVSPLPGWERRPPRARPHQPGLGQADRPRLRPRRRSAVGLLVAAARRLGRRRLPERPHRLSRAAGRPRGHRLRRLPRGRRPPLLHPANPARRDAGP